MDDRLEERQPSTTESTYPFFRTLFGIPYGWPALLERMTRGDAVHHWPGAYESYLMPVDEYVDEDHLIIRAALPGLDPERDIEISVSGGVLRIRAERRQASDDAERGFRRREIMYGPVTRDVALPAAARAENVDASYQDGILTIRVPLDRGDVGAKTIRIRKV